MSFDTVILYSSPSNNNMVLFYHFLDNASRYSFAYATRNNDAHTTRSVLHCLRIDCAHLGFEVQHIKSDRGELLDTSVQTYIADQGWSIEFTAADASASNAQIENKHFRICQSARAMLDHACLKQTFWDAAIAQATRVWNHWFSSHLQTKQKEDPKVELVPALELRRLLRDAGRDLWTYVNEAKMLKVWGCLCYAYIVKKAVSYTHLTLPTILLV